MENTLSIALVLAFILFALVRLVGHI